MADPTVRADSGIHQPATLGWYCGLFGPSGSGKGNAENTAEELTPFPAVDLAYIDISTGQGLIAAYLDLDIDPDDDAGRRRSSFSVGPAATPSPPRAASSTPWHRCPRPQPSTASSARHG
jgi:hypothetical protein